MVEQKSSGFIDISSLLDEPPPPTLTPDQLRKIRGRMRAASIQSYELGLKDPVSSHEISSLEPSRGRERHTNGGVDAGWAQRLYSGQAE